MFSSVTTDFGPSTTSCLFVLWVLFFHDSTATRHTFSRVTGLKATWRRSNVFRTQLKSFYRSCVSLTINSCMTWSRMPDWSLTCMPHWSHEMLLLPYGSQWLSKMFSRPRFILLRRLNQTSRTQLFLALVLGVIIHISRFYHITMPCR